MAEPDVFEFYRVIATPKQIEAAAKQAYLNNRASDTPWEGVEEHHKEAWRAKVKTVVEAALNAERRVT